MTFDSSSLSMLPLVAGSVKDVTWKDVSVGQLLVVRDDELFPADLLCLWSELPEHVCFIKTTNLDGETNLKNRRPLDLKKEGTSERQVRCAIYAVCSARWCCLTSLCDELHVLRRDDNLGLGDLNNSWPLDSEKEGTSERKVSRTPACWTTAVASTGSPGNT